MNNFDGYPKKATKTVVCWVCGVCPRAHQTRDTASKCIENTLREKATGNEWTRAKLVGLLAIRADGATYKECGKAF